MPPEASPGSDHRVLVLPPTRRDGEVTCSVLERVGLSCTVCEDGSKLAGQIVIGMGAILLTDAVTLDRDLDRVTEALSQQPAWSDVPTIVLSRTDRQSLAMTKLFELLTNVTILDRPTSTRTLVSAVQTAIRGRQRQYQIRDQLDALHKAEEALRNTDRRKDEFLAMLAHELRNPLAPLRSASEFLERTVGREPRTNATLGIVKRQVTQLTRLVDDLLDVSRITQGRIQLQKAPVALVSIVNEALESAQPLVLEKSQKLTFTSDSTPLFVNGDSARLVQCIANLLINSAKYTDSRGKIEVELRGEPTVAVISVTDNGVGISAELLPQIFELFVQSDRSLDRSEGGLGIGLSVVHRLVEMHGGQVEAGSAGPGRGSRFTIKLPRIRAPHELAAKSDQHSVRSKRILVADDNEDAALSLAQLLELDGHETQAVYSAKEALARTADFQPDIVLLDIGLPDMNGYLVAEAIRRSGIAVKLVALTGYGQARDVDRARESGFDAHLVKPVDFDALARVIAGRQTSLDGGLPRAV